MNLCYWKQLLHIFLGKLGSKLQRICRSLLNIQSTCHKLNVRFNHSSFWHEFSIVLQLKKSNEKLESPIFKEYSDAKRLVVFYYAARKEVLCGFFGDHLCGKTALIAQLLVENGFFSRERLVEVQKRARIRARSTNTSASVYWPPFLIDTTADEGLQNCSTRVTGYPLFTARHLGLNRDCILFNCPGKQDYFNTLMRSIFWMNLFILVVDYEPNIKYPVEIRRATQFMEIAYSLQQRHLIIAINIVCSFFFLFLFR